MIDRDSTDAHWLAPVEAIGTEVSSSRRYGVFPVDTELSDIRLEAFRGILTVGLLNSQVVGQQPNLAGFAKATRTGLSNARGLLDNNLMSIGSSSIEITELSYDFPNSRWNIRAEGLDDWQQALRNGIGTSTFRLTVAGTSVDISTSNSSIVSDILRVNMVLPSANDGGPIALNNELDVVLDIPFVTSGDNLSNLPRYPLNFSYNSINNAHLRSHSLFKGNWNPLARYNIGDIVLFNNGRNRFYIANFSGISNRTPSASDSGWGVIDSEGDATLLKGEWMSTESYAKGDIVEYLNRYWLSTTAKNPTTTRPTADSGWHPLDNNVSYRGDWIANVGVYTYGDIVRSSNRLWLLIAQLKDNLGTAPEADDDWLELGGGGAEPVQATETVSGIAEIATQAETTAGTDDTKIITPLKLQQKVDAIPSGGGGTSDDLVGVNVHTIDNLRLEIDGQTFSNPTESIQFDKEDIENKELVLIGENAGNLRLVLSIQGSNKEYWDGVEFIIANGSNKTLSTYGVATGAGIGATISGSTGNISSLIEIPPKGRASVFIRTSNVIHGSISTQGLTLYIRRLNESRVGSATTTTRGSIELATEAEVKDFSDDQRAVTPLQLSNSIKDFAKEQTPDVKLPHTEISPAIQWIDNGGVIEPTTGFENMTLVYKTQTGIGSNFPEWVNSNLDRHFTLQSSEVGSGQDLQHNYDLVLKDGTIRSQNILPITDLDNLLGITFIQYPSAPSLGDTMVHRLTTPWIQERTDLFPVTESSVNITIPAKRIDITRGITHILVRSGRVSGISDTSSRTEIINAVTDDGNIFGEILFPISVPYTVQNTAIARRDRSSAYGVNFASSVTCGIESEHLFATGTTNIKAIVNNATSNFNGDEFLAFYAVRGMGG